MAGKMTSFILPGNCALRSRRGKNKQCNYQPGTGGSLSCFSHKKRPISIANCQYGNPVSASQSNAATDPEDGEKLLHIVFVHPQIHWNTGNIGRTCLGLGAALHLVGPIGFSLEERQIRRAGLDYWQHVDLHVYDDWLQFANGKMKDLGGTRLFFTKFGEQCATDIEWPGEGKIVMIFGSEVDGFDGIRDWLDTQGQDERRVSFPMVDDRFRSFNLSTTASMALWDAYKNVDKRGKKRTMLNTLQTDNSSVVNHF